MFKLQIWVGWLLAIVNPDISVLHLPLAGDGASPAFGSTQDPIPD